jgi:hypothetical protein
VAKATQGKATGTGFGGSAGETAKRSSASSVTVAATSSEPAFAHGRGNGSPGGWRWAQLVQARGPPPQAGAPGADRWAKPVQAGGLLPHGVDCAEPSNLNREYKPHIPTNVEQAKIKP